MHQIIEKKIMLDLCENPIPINYGEVPEYTRQDFEERIDSLMRMAREKGYSSIIIYGDREHQANISYFTGFDVRFEEALLVFINGRRPILIVGNEGMGYSNIIPIDVEKVLYQPFGLMGQPNDDCKSLLQIFKDCGFEKDSKIGVIGWKKYRDSDFSTGYSILDVPSYIIETLSQAVDRGQLINAVDIMADNDYGLKHRLSAKEVVRFELQGTRASRRVYNLIKNLREGITEIEASEFLRMDGEPTSVHPMISFGDFNTGLGLRSPTYYQKLHLGDPVGAGIGFRGSLVHKSGFFIRSIEDLPEEKRHYLDAFLKPYFASVVTWYEMMRIGNTGGEIYDAVDSMLGLKKFGVVLNPGHLTHTDEWTNSPFARGNRTKIRSGMGVQCDYTVVFQNPFFTAHVEDGLVIADQMLREEIKKLSPSCYERIEARRRFFKDVLNIGIADEVLPLSDLGGVCFPYLADTSIILCKA